MKKNDWKLLVIFGGILLLALFNFAFGFDYYWHVKVGEYIISNLKIPYYDIFSWYGMSKNLYWVSHEWLSEVILYIYKFIFNSLGPFVYCISTYLILIFVLFKCNKEKLQKNIIFTFFWALLGTLVFSLVMLPRPHMISYVLLALTIYILYDNFDKKDSNKIYFLPLISLFWANFHGGSSNLTYILCFVFLLAGLFTFRFGKIEAKKIGKKQINKYIICGLLSVLMITVNPHSIKMIAYPYVNMNDTLMIANIEEWASPSLNNNSHYGCFLVLGSIIFTMIATRKKIKLVDLIVVGLFLVLGFKSIKFIPLLYIAATFIIFNFIEEFKFRIPNTTTISIFLTLLLSYGILIPNLISRYEKKLIPDEIILYIKNQAPKKLFNYYGYGGYLIYNEIPVFIDGRADMYSKHNFKDLLILQRIGDESLICKYNFDMFIIPKELPLNIYLSVNTNYKVTKEIDDVIVYEKTK